MPRKRKPRKLTVDERLEWFRIRVKEARESKGLSQLDLARKTDSTRSLIAMIEGSSTPSIRTLLRLCEALGKTPNDLLDYP